MTTSAPHADLPTFVAEPPQSPRERVFVNTLAIVAGQVASDGTLAVAALIQIRALDQASWGLIGYLLSLLEILRVLTDAGLHVVGIRLLAIGARPARFVLRHVLLLKNLLCVLGVAVVAVASLVVPSLSAHRDLVWGLGVSIFPIAYTARLILRFQADHRMERLIAPRAVASALYLLAIVATTMWHPSVSAYIAIYVAYQFLLWLAISIASGRTWPTRGEPVIPSRIDWPFAWAMTRQASAVGLVMLLVVAYSRLGIIFLERLGSLAMVGQYYAAVKISEPLLALAGAFSMSAFPVLSRLVASRNATETPRRFVRYSIRSALFCCAVAGALTMVGRDLLVWIRPEYGAAAGALTALAWATVFMFQNQLSTALINAFGKFHYVTAICAVNLAVFLVLCYLLVPGLGATGAALALLGTEAGNSVAQLATVFVLLRRLERPGSSL